MINPTETELQPSWLSGAHAILGVDVVDFSLLSNDDQIILMRHLLDWIRAALAYHGVEEGTYRWSPAGDGGYITFATPGGCEAAIDIGCSIMEKADRDRWSPKGRLALHLRCAIHSGVVEESQQLGGTTNIWGEGINTTARILSICGPSQILISEQYYQHYLQGKPQDHILQLSSVFHRTVKHGLHVSLRNVAKRDLGIDEEQAAFLRWSAIGALWQRTCSAFDCLISDCMNSNNPLAALAASKFLLSLDPMAKGADTLFKALSYSSEPVETNYEPRKHPIFSNLTPKALRTVVEQSTPRIFQPGEVICRDGEAADSCYFPVYGRIEVELNIDPKPRVGQGAIVGEFGFWIPGMRRTATLKAKDECLLLELPVDVFQAVAQQYPDVVSAVAATIQQRILANVVSSREFFPDLLEADREELAKAPSACEKLDRGARIDLSRRSVFLFSGKVRILTGLQIAAPGRFGHERVVGIVTLLEPVSLDGVEAEAIEPSVIVSIPHDAILRMQQRYESVDSAWNGFWGKRHFELKRQSPRREPSA